ncbi:MAG TPA: type IV secretion system protein VirB10 [Steroidobacteraceae bacterium]|nr:type IV secretion system protein VirB10 [Steroidobacteraceae bacterium]
MNEVPAQDVQGERGTPSVSRVRSLQSRLSSIVACTLMLIVGAAMLTWYYATALSRQRHARRAEQATLAMRAQSEMPLPSLGKIDSWPAGAPRGPGSAVPSAPAGPAPDSPPQPLPSLPLAPAPQSSAISMPLAYGAAPTPYGTPSLKSSSQSALERRLSGVAFASTASPSAAPTEAAGSGNGPHSESELASLLRPDVAPPAQARYLSAPRFLLAKGTFIDCTLETAIDSTLPGMTACVTATDTFGADGKVVLLERGTKLIGETRGQVQQGAARVFVLWTEARTPAGIIVPLDSPGADELGRSGLSGEVNHHFWDRFGAAILISTLDGAVQAAVQSTSRNSGTVIYNPATSEGIVTDVLKGTLNVAPTVTKENGERIQVFVARDLDFRPVYDLRTAVAAH